MYIQISDLQVQNSRVSINIWSSLVVLSYHQHTVFKGKVVLDHAVNAYKRNRKITPRVLKLGTRRCEPTQAPAWKNPEPLLVH